MRKSIANAVRRGGFIHIYDERGSAIGCIPCGLGPDDGLVGYTSHTVNVRRGDLIFTYDERGSSLGSVCAPLPRSSSGGVGGRDAPPHAQDRSHVHDFPKSPTSRTTRDEHQNHSRQSSQNDSRNESDGEALGPLIGWGIAICILAVVAISPGLLLNWVFGRLTDHLDGLFWASLKDKATWVVSGVIWLYFLFVYWMIRRSRAQK